MCSLQESGRGEWVEVRGSKKTQDQALALLRPFHSRVVLSKMCLQLVTQWVII